MWMLSLMLLERNKQGTRFNPSEWLRALIYQRHNMTMHSSFITFWAAARFSVHPGQKCIIISLFKFHFELKHSFKKYKQTNKKNLKNIGFLIQSAHSSLFFWSTVLRKLLFEVVLNFIQSYKSKPGSRVWNLKIK